VELGRQAIDRLDVRTAAKSYLKALARESGESANLVALVNGRATCIDIEPSASVLSATNNVGDMIPLHATAAGKVLLAFLPEAGRAKTLASDPLVAHTPHTLTDAKELEVRLQQIALNGYAIDDEESTMGVRCVAAPICDHRGRAVASLSVSGPTMRVTWESVPALADLVKKAAADISAALGCPRR
jgi:DNA-binding IclR family transcriptional regulator